jgi:hypothetical protein
MKKIAKLLKADFNESSDLASIAAMLAGKGRGNDTLLAHITPREAEILKAAGGSGTTNPDTGLLEFYDGEGGYDTGGFEGLTQQQVDTATPVPSSGEVAAQQFPDYGPTTGATTSAGLPFTTAPERVYEPVQAPAQTPVPTISSAPYVATSADRAALFGEGGYGAKASPTELAVPSPAPQEKSFFDKLTTEQMARLGLAGGLGIYGAQQAKKGGQQAQQAASEQRAVGAPYQAKGQELQRAAQAGELTPTGQQSLQALQARLAQGAESRGGVGAAQVAAQAEAYRQQLLSQQYNLGLQVSNIGDNIALGAIKTGLQADQMLNQASTNFYTNLAAIGAGIPISREK